MLALCVGWNGRAVDPGVAARLAQSLAAGTGRRARTHRIGEKLVAATLAPAASVSRDGRTVFFHGFVQNHRALRRELGVVEAHPAALYAAALARWGDDADAYMLGEYAAVSINEAGPVLRLARSPIIAPPLRFHRSDDLLVIASAARVIHATGALDAVVDEQKIADSLYLNYTEADRDWFCGITRVRVGEVVTHTPGGVRARRYHDLGALPRVRLRTDADYVEAASALFAQATRAALNGRTRPAVALSGGLDSQAVAAEALAQMPPGETLLALTGVPEPGWDRVDRPGTFGDERAHVAALGRRYPGLRTDTVDAAGRSFDYRQPEMFFHAGSPPRNAMNLHWLHDLYDRAREAGCDVLLTGAMGNLSASFDGSGAPAGWFARGRWQRLMREVGAPAPTGQRLRTVAREALLPHLPGVLRRHRVRSLPDWCPLAPDYAQAMRVVERAVATTATSTRAWRVAAFEGAAGDLGDINQAMELIHGIPMRDPMAFRPLVEFCMGIPDEQFWRDGVRRRLLKWMLRGRVADEVVDERRAGAQCADWHGRLARQRDELRREIASLREDPAMAHRLDLDRLAAAMDRFPTATPTGPDQTLLQLALPRALTTARFIRSVERRNL